MEDNNQLQKNTCPACLGSPETDGWEYVLTKNPNKLDNYRICNHCRRAWSISIKTYLSNLGLIKAFEGYTLISIQVLYKFFSLKPELSFILVGDRLSPQQMSMIQDGLEQTVASYSLQSEVSAFLVRLLRRSPILGVKKRKSNLKDFVGQLKKCENNGKYLSSIDPLFPQTIILVGELQKRGRRIITVKTVRKLLGIDTAEFKRVRQITRAFQWLERANYLTCIERTSYKKYKISPEFSQKVEGILQIFSKKILNPNQGAFKPKKEWRL